MASLNLSEYTPKINGIEVTPEYQTAKGKQVRTYGIIALVLLPFGLIPVLGFLAVIASFVLAKIALKISAGNFVAEEYERPARWAWTISLVLLILSAIGLFLMLVR